MKKGFVLALLICVSTMLLAGCGGGGEKTVEDIFNREPKVNELLGNWVAEDGYLKIEIKKDGTMDREISYDGYHSKQTVYWEIIDETDSEYNFKFRYEEDPLNEGWHYTNIYVSDDGKSLFREEGYKQFDPWHRADEMVESARQAVDVDVIDEYVIDGNIVTELELTNNGELSYTNIFIHLEYRDENEKTIFKDCRALLDDEFLNPGETKQIEIKRATKFVREPNSAEDIDIVRCYIGDYLRY